MGRKNDARHPLVAAPETWAPKPSPRLESNSTNPEPNERHLMIHRLSPFLQRAIGLAIVAPWLVHAADDTAFTRVRPQPADLVATAKTKQEALFTVAWLFAGQGAMNRGFFIDETGLAICELKPFCLDLARRFEANDGKQLPAPKLLAVLANRNVALVRFDHRPKQWLQLAERAPEPGTWVAILSTARDPDPLACPIMRRFESTDTTSTVPRKFNLISLAAGRSPKLARIFASGAPVLDAKGQVVAIYSNETPLEQQTLYFAEVIDGLSSELAEVKRHPAGIPVPVASTAHLYDPVQLDPASALLGQARSARDLELARKHSAALLAKYPDSRLAKAIDQDLEQQTRGPGSPQALKRNPPAAGTDDLDKILYYRRLGFAQMEAKELREAARSFLRCYELAPKEGSLDAANLGFLYLNLGELAEAERWYRIAVGLCPERIDYLEGLRLVLDARNDWKSSDALSERVFELEHLYRSH